PLPSPPDSAERARAAAVALPQVLVEALRELEGDPHEVDYYKSFQLSWEDFKSTREVIEATFRRFDYDPFKARITIRMPTTIHDCFASSVNTVVLEKLRLLPNDNATTAKFVDNIRPMLSSDIFLDNPRQPADQDDDADKEEKKTPDLQYSHIHSKHPGVVVEVAYTQEGKKLKKLAHDYIRGSAGEIRTVVGFNLNTHKESTVSDLKEVPFRSANREPLNQDRGLPIFCLHDMTADKSLLEGVENLSISLPFKALYAFLDKAENIQRLRRAKKKSQLGGFPVKITEPPSSSPEEELASADERTFAEQEETQEKKATKSDRSYPRRTREVDTTEPNVTTRSAKRSAPTDTGADLRVPKRRPGSKRR
ncbi:hypothetical protein FMUND_14863, partial [Fusarium mundagurra]